ncbi:hypothetical protein HEK616_80380 (plasmid) [Streptomyces nigrescens]|uniref:Aldehyde oxidase/xanthine dehydrogenase second molybdopterin binding domain-containing protein n=1 Tax=Streptomyces nigrescens TaxID=1920 RepID=A0ABN6R9B6_STRNI|nr:hypothetical protein HEK616_80380 [Streptomyces nigrescens]
MSEVVDLEEIFDIGPGEHMLSPIGEEEDLHIASYGLDQCLSVVRKAIAEDTSAEQAPAGWLVGQGTGMAMIATGPPGGHYADARVSLLTDGTYDIAVGTAEFGNGTTTVHKQITAGALNTTEDRIAIRQSDTDVVRHDTGAFGSAGTVVAGKAVLLAATALAERLQTFAARHTGVARHLCTLGAEAFDCAGRVVPLKELVEAAHEKGAAEELAADGRWGGSPRSVAFNAQWFRIAVDPGTGEIRILRSVHAADAGKVMNPMQCRGQVEGGVAQALGATLFENVRIDERGEVTTAAFRRYRLPQYADIPRTDGPLHGDHGRHRAAGSQVDEREPLQPRRPRLRQRAARRHRHPLHGNAGDPGPCLARTRPPRPYLIRRAPGSWCMNLEDAPARRPRTTSAHTSSPSAHASLLAAGGGSTTPPRTPTQPRSAP